MLVEWDTSVTAQVIESDEVLDCRLLPETSSREMGPPGIVACLGRAVLFP